MKKRVVISDIAKALGVSVTTVSFVLNGKAKEKRISESLAKRILDYVEKVGYKPNHSAKNARTGAAKVIALLVEDITNPFFSQVAQYIEEKAQQHGFRALYCSTDNDEYKTKQLIQLFRDRQVEGFIITPSEGLQDTVAEMMRNGIPMVLFDRFLPLVDTSYVVSDNLAAACDATKHLLNGGNKRIGLLSLYSNQTQMRARLDGYMQAMDEFQVQSFIKKIKFDKESEEDAEKQIYEFVMDNKLDALLFTTNYLATKGLQAFKNKRADLPNIVSFDEHALFDLHSPSITAVKQNVELLASELVHTLIMDIQGKLREPRKIVVPCELVIRESSIPLSEQSS